MRVSSPAFAMFLLASGAASFSPRSFARAGRPLASLFSAAASSDTCANPLLDQASLPKFGAIEPKHLQPAVDELLSDMSAKFSELEVSESLMVDDVKCPNNNNLLHPSLPPQSGLDPSSSTYDDILPSLERIREPISYAWGVAGHLNGVKNGDELRKAYEASQPKVVKAFTEFKQSRVLYDAMRNVMDTNKSILNEEQSRALESSLHAMQLGGVGLDGAEKVRFNEVRACEELRCCQLRRGI